MTLLYADTSGLVRAYFDDEPEHEALRELLLESSEPVVTSELTRVEFASAITAAYRGGRVADAKTVLDRFDADCGTDGGITLLRLDPTSALPTARRLVIEQAVRSLDAIHLAVALTDASELAAGEQVTVVTRDDRQVAAARACGLDIA